MNENFSMEAESSGEAGNKPEGKKSKIFGKGFIGKDKSSETKSTVKKSFIQKVGIQNLCILLVLGFALIFLVYLEGKEPNGTKKPKKEPTDTTVGESLESNPIYAETTSETEEYISTLETKLKEKLQLVKGIGKVEVFITSAESKELVTLKDAPYTQDSVNEKDGEGGSRESNTMKREDETVMSTTESGASSPYIIKEIQPTIEGVLVVAEGGNDPEIEMDIVETVEALFGVPAHKTKVLEMGK